MKKLINISLIFAFILAFASCEKEDIRPNHDKEGFGCFGEFEDGNTRGGLDGGTDELIRDPDDDEDYDENEGGTGTIVDPDDDEDYDEDEGK